MALTTYRERVNQFDSEYQHLRKQLRWLSAVRLALFLSTLLLGYYYFSGGHAALLYVALTAFVGFLIMIRFYDAVKRKADIARTLTQINQVEIKLLEGDVSPFPGGDEFQDSHHPYSYDLDLFGGGSLFQYLNRTTTAFGKKSLSKSLLQPNATEIENRQVAIRELSGMIDLRQNLQAWGTVHSSEEKKFDRLKQWLATPETFESAGSYYFLFIFPVATIVCIFLAIFSKYPVFQSISALLAILNLGITLTFAKKMLLYIGVSSDINKTLQQFSEQLEVIEKGSFNAPALQKLQQQLRTGPQLSSGLIAGLRSRFNYLDYFFNIFVSPLLNGLFLFHIHVLYSLDKWKKANRANVTQWLEAVGEMESLSSFGNFSFNNVGFVFPELSKEEDLHAEDLGHPLIAPSKRINNSISFTQQKFIVLTGSNMSGKSTFLRTLGINLILARAGSPVCASQYRFYPYDVYVSMRITDSLQDSESLFYAELKRLHTIIAHITAGNKTFVILDEILRGTNSNDKHNGTVGLIRKLVSRNACGIIATHDLSVALLANEYPAFISDKCFESEIINDELIFDYKIKDGVCTKLSASFLMKKMGIIE